MRREGASAKTAAASSARGTSGFVAGGAASEYYKAVASTNAGHDRAVSRRPHILKYLGIVASDMCDDVLQY